MANEGNDTGAQNSGAKNQGATAGFQRTESGGAQLTVPPLSQLVEPKRLLWYGGLAALGVIGVLEWPVLAVVGAGTYVAEQFAKSDIQGGGQDRR